MRNKHICISKPAAQDLGNWHAVLLLQFPLWHESAQDVSIERYKFWLMLMFKTWLSGSSLNWVGITQRPHFYSSPCCENEQKHVLHLVRPAMFCDLSGGDKSALKLALLVHLGWILELLILCLWRVGWLSTASDGSKALSIFRGHVLMILCKIYTEVSLHRASWSNSQCYEDGALCPLFHNQFQKKELHQTHLVYSPSKS